MRVDGGVPWRGSVVDAFTAVPFAGNPAGIVLLPPAADAAEPDDDWHRKIAAEFNLSETSFLTDRGDGSWGLRWFTPTVEVALCGHATLAAAHWLTEQGLAGDSITFRTRSGDLGAGRDAAGGYVLDLPVSPVVEPDPALDLSAALGGISYRWVGCTAGGRADRYGLAVLDPADLIALVPDQTALLALDLLGLIVTARPDPADPEFAGVDVISRFFAPAIGIPEDPVTGAAHCTLIDYWSPLIGRELVRFRQVSARGGALQVTLAGSRALVAGQAITVWDVAPRVTHPG